jgi:hypothetical protein
MSLHHPVFIARIRGNQNQRTDFNFTFGTARAASEA